MANIYYYTKILNSYYRNPENTDQVSRTYSSKENWTGAYHDKFDTKNPKFLVYNTPWTYGIAQETNSSNRREIKKLRDGTCPVFSILPPQTSDHYNKRKIIRKIEISCETNLIENHKDMLKYSIVAVKKSIYKDPDSNNLANIDNFRKNPTFGSGWISGDKPTFVLDNINFDLAADEDIILLQEVKTKPFDSHWNLSLYVSTSKFSYSDRRAGIATKCYCLYNITVQYEVGGII